MITSARTRSPADRPRGRRQSPLRPPDLASTRTSVITAARSIALIMSITVRPATADRGQGLHLHASPVGGPDRRGDLHAVVDHLGCDLHAAERTADGRAGSGPGSSSPPGCRRSGRRPARRPWAPTRPAGRPRTRRCSSTRPAAVAVRAVTALPETSTIRASPVALRWGSRASLTAASQSLGLVEQPHVDLLPGGDELGVLGQDHQRVGAGKIASRCEPCPPASSTCRLPSRSR